MASKVSRTELCLRGIGYTILGLAGPWVLFEPPETFPAPWSTTVIIACGVLILSSFVAGVASFFARYRIEMIVLPIIGSAMFAYTVSIFYLVPVIPSRGAQALVYLAFFFMLGARFISTMHLARQPSPKTQEIPVIEDSK